MKQVGLVLAIAAVAWFTYTQLTAPKPFDADVAEEVATEITHTIGASMMQRGAFGRAFCDSSPFVNAQICFGHAMNPIEARNAVDKLLKPYAAKPEGGWTAMDVGYFRKWIYGTALEDELNVVITTEMLVIDWGLTAAERFGF